MHKMSSVTILTQYFYPHHGATSQLMTDLAKGLSQHGYTVNIFTETQSKETTPESFSKININRTFSPVKSSTSIFSKIISSIFFLLGAVAYVIFNLPGNVPLLIVSNPPYAGILGILFNIVSRGKYYFLLQDIFPESAAMSGIMKQNSILYKFFSKLIYLTVKLFCFYS